MLCAMLLLVGAPLPYVKPVPPPSPVGQWVLEWKGRRGPCWFDKDGCFGCVWQGQYWMGHWKLKDGVLVVHEWMPARDEWTPSSVVINWAAVLKAGKLEGSLKCGGDFALRKR